MHGNVWEWCQDRFAKYGKAQVDEPTGPPEGSSRVFRGGGWGDDAGDCRSATRIFYQPGDRINLLGFLVSRVPADE